MLASKHAQLPSYYSVWHFLCGVFVVSMTTKYRAQTRAPASSPHGATRVVEDGQDNTQSLALTLTCHSHADKDSVYYSCRSVCRCLHRVLEICVCVCFIYAYCYLSGGYSWNFWMFFSPVTARRRLFNVLHLFVEECVPVVYVCVIIKAQLWNHLLQLSCVQWRWLSFYSDAFILDSFWHYFNLRVFFGGHFGPCGISTLLKFTFTL